jgi:hypothetical protein
MADVKPMKLSDFERKVQVFKPRFLSICKKWNGKKFEICDVFVHFEPSICYLKSGPNALAQMLEHLKIIRRSPSDNSIPS